MMGKKLLTLLLVLCVALSCTTLFACVAPSDVTVAQGDILTKENYDSIMTLGNYDCVVHGEMTGAKQDLQLPNV